MSDLTGKQKGILFGMCNMEQGYFLDFTDNSLDNFVLKSTGKSIHNYTDYGTSKAKKVKSFLDKEVNDTVIKFLQQLNEEKLCNDKEINDVIIFLKDFEKGKIIQPHEKVKDFKHLSEFIEEGGKHLNEGRYWDCITNAKTIIEITLKEICSRFNLRYNDDIIKSLNVVKDFFGMNAGNKDYPDYIKGMITAISGMVNNISQARNESSSAHAPEYVPKKHHAKFILETAVSLTTFLISVMELKLAKVNS
jgi:hypothetical protein